MSYFQKIVSKNIKRLEILQKCQLNNISPKYNEEIIGLNISLKQHQLTLIHACLKLEDSRADLIKLEKQLCNNKCLKLQKHDTLVLISFYFLYYDFNTTFFTICYLLS